jgi:hypothetical protein
VKGLEDATGAVTAWLRKDPDTRKLIDGIRSLVAGVPAPTPVTRCPGTTSAGADAELHAIDGRYTTLVTARELRKAGVRNPDQVRENTGRYSWALTAGAWTFHQQVNHYVQNPDDSGRYTYRNGHFTLHWDPGPRGWTKATLRVARNGTLHFLHVRDAQAVNQALSEGIFAQPWFRIGN